METPIFLHPAKRQELLAAGQTLFNNDEFFEAHEAWEELWHLEAGRDREFLQGLILVAAHFVHLAKGNWSGAVGVASNAQMKLAILPVNGAYKALDIEPLTGALTYNVKTLNASGLLRDPSTMSTGSLRLMPQPPPPPDAFLTPKLFEK